MAPRNIRRVIVYLNTEREQEFFERIKETLGETDTGVFTYILKRYAEEHSLISEALHNK